MAGRSSALEAHGLVRPVEERRWGGLTETMYVATAASYVVSPSALGPAAGDPARASACARAMVIGHAAASADQGWAALSAALGLSGAMEGQRVEAAAPGFPAIVGVVERVAENQVTIRTEQPAPGFAWIAVEDCGVPGPQPRTAADARGAGPDGVAGRRGRTARLVVVNRRRDSPPPSVTFANDSSKRLEPQFGTKVPLER